MNIENKEYLNKHNITSLEDLVGRDVFCAFASQGIKKFMIRKIEFTHKHREWFFVINRLLY